MSLLMQHHVQQSDKGFLGLKLDFHIRAWEGINVDGSGDFVSLTDLTGNGYDFTRYDEGIDPIEIVPSGIGGKQALRFDGTNGIFFDTSSKGWVSGDTEIFHFCVFKIEGNPNTSLGYISGCYNSHESFGNYYSMGYQAGIFKGFGTPNVVNSTISAVNGTSHYFYQNVKFTPSVNSSSGTFFSFDGEPKLYITTQVSAGMNNAHWEIGGIRSNRRARMLFCEAGAVRMSYDKITPTFLSNLATYINDTYGL